MTMFPGAPLLLTRDVTALRQGDDSPVLCKLGRGSVVTVAGMTRESAFVQISCAGSLYEVFSDDLEAVSERTDEPERLVEPERKPGS